MRLRYWTWLFGVQVVWASSYVAMKVAVGEMPVGGVVFLRYGIASLGFLIIWGLTSFPRFARRDLALIAALGVLNFALTPILQVTGLRYTQAIDASILISFEPLITVLVATIALRERPTKRTMLALFLATMGLMILSGVSLPGGGGGRQIRLIGNLLFLASLVFEAAVSVGGRALGPRYRADHLIGAMKMAGFLAGAAVSAPTLGRMDFGQITWQGWSAVLFLGLACSIFTYVVWFRVLKVVPVNQVALSLFIQPLAGTLLGSSLLGETINLRTLLGALLICLSLIWWQVREIRAVEVRVAEEPAEVTG